MNAHEKLNYVEFAARDLSATKTLFSADIQSTLQRVIAISGMYVEPLLANEAGA
jgi:hypothetical protein